MGSRLTLCQERSADLIRQSLWRFSTFHRSWDLKKEKTSIYNFWFLILCTDDGENKINYIPVTNCKISQIRLISYITESSESNSCVRVVMCWNCDRFLRNSICKLCTCINYLLCNEQLRGGYLI